MQRFFRSFKELDDVTCPECGKSFFNKNVMQRHYRTVHTSEKPFTCWHCSFATNRQANLRGHCERKHNMAPETFAQKARETFKRVVVADDPMDGSARKKKKGRKLTKLVVEQSTSSTVDEQMLV